MPHFDPHLSLFIHTPTIALAAVRVIVGIEGGEGSGEDRKRERERIRVEQKEKILGRAGYVFI